MGRGSSADCVRLAISELKPVTSWLPFNSARSKLIANRMLPKPVQNCKQKQLDQIVIKDWYSNEQVKIIVWAFCLLLPSIIILAIYWTWILIFCPSVLDACTFLSSYSIRVLPYELLHTSNHITPSLCTPSFGRVFVNELINKVDASSGRLERFGCRSHYITITELMNKLKY